MATLITGGTGMVGSYVARLMISRGETPVLLDRSPDEKQTRDIRQQAKIIRGDILDLLGLVKIIKKENIDRIVHTAGALAAAATEDPVTAIKVNVEGGANILEAAKLMGVRRVVFTSTRLVYDCTRIPENPIDEDYTKLTNGLYGVYASTKLACEHLGQNYSELYGVEFAAVRFARVFGPGYWNAESTPNTGARTLKDLIEKTMVGQPVTIRRPKSVSDDWLYVKDAAQAVDLACNAPRLNHHAYNIGPGRMYEFDEVLRIVKKHLPELRVTVLENDTPPDSAGTRQPPMPTPMEMDISRARKDLGYEPQYLLDAAIPDFVKTVSRIQGVTSAS
jgi:UDP-glucose 4-epimerase